MRIRVLFFGQAKDFAGRAEDWFDAPPASTLGSIWNHYSSLYPALGRLASSLVVARNQEFASMDEAVSENDEVAFLPPVSGGAGGYLAEMETEAGHFFALTREPINPEPLRRRLLRAEDGALAVFEGTVRNNTKGRATRYLDYECYEEMALKLMARIGLEIAAAHPIGRIAMVHRLGRMEIGETSVFIGVSSPHRGPAFKAAEEGINRLKKVVPIWKKEYFVDGEVWVEGDWDESVLRR